MPYESHFKVKNEDIGADNTLIEQKLEIEGLKLPENKKIRDELIGLLRKESDLSLRRIAEVLQINREVARRAVALLSKEPSS